MSPKKRGRLFKRSSKGADTDLKNRKVEKRPSGSAIYSTKKRDSTGFLLDDIGPGHILRSIWSVYSGIHHANYHLLGKIRARGESSPSPRLNDELSMICITSPSSPTQNYDYGEDSPSQRMARVDSISELSDGNTTYHESIFACTPRNENKDMDFNIPDDGNNALQKSVSCLELDQIGSNPLRRSSSSLLTKQVVRTNSSKGQISMFRFGQSDVDLTLTRKRSQSRSSVTLGDEMRHMRMKQLYKSSTRRHNSISSRGITVKDSNDRSYVVFRDVDLQGKRVQHIYRIPRAPNEAKCVSLDHDYILPIDKRLSSEKQCKTTISPKTFARALRGEFPRMKELIIVDARWAFEYDGGHIQYGPYKAKNICFAETLNSYFFQRQVAKEGLVIVFHCEFSSVRAVKRLKDLKNFDAKIHSNCLEKCFYRDAYLLYGGYSKFWTEYREFCNGGMGHYIKMANPNYIGDCQRHSEIESQHDRENSISYVDSRVIEAAACNSEVIDLASSFNRVSLSEDEDELENINTQTNYG